MQYVAYNIMVSNGKRKKMNLNMRFIGMDSGSSLAINRTLIMT